MSNITVVDGFPVLNPLTAYVFLPPQVASELDIVNYVAIGVAGVSVPLLWSSGRADERQAYVWDLLNSVRQDYILVSKQSRMRLPTYIYFLSKLSTFGFILLSMIFQTASISHCFASLKALAVIFVFAMPSTSLLFFFRARALFLSTPLATACFGILWLGVLGGSLITIPALGGVNIGPTRRCVIGVNRSYSVVGTITPLINDTIVFLAISWRLCYNDNWARPTLKNGARMMIFGDHLPRFSKSLLQDGQIYFLTTVGANIVTVIMAAAPGIPEPLRAVCTIPNTALMNVMACRVFRKTFLAASGSTHQSSSHPVSLSLMEIHNSGGSALTASTKAKKPSTDDLLTYTKTADASATV